MTQIFRTQECKPHHLKALIGAAIHNTNFSSVITSDHMYKKFCGMFPDNVTPTKTMEMEEHWVLWRTYLNINLWFDGKKKCFLHYRYVINEWQRVVDMFDGHKLPWEIDGEIFYDNQYYFHCSFWFLLSHQIKIFLLFYSQVNLMSEVSYEYPILHCIINFDKSHINKLSQNDNGEPINLLTNPNLPQSGLQVVKDPGNHTTGFFGSTPLEPLPAILKIQTQWVENLPIVKGVWGLETECAMDNHVAVQRKGSMDEDLFIQTVLF